MILSVKTNTVSPMDLQNNMESSVKDLVNLSLFVGIAKAIASAKTSDEVCASVMKQIEQIFSPSNWSLLLYDQEKDELVFEVVVGQSNKILKGYRISAKTGIAGWIFSHKEGVIIDNVSDDPRFSKLVDGISDFETKSIVGVPLVVDGEAIGVIELVNKSSGENFSSLEMKILSTIADFAAIAMERARYFNIIQQMSYQDPLTGVGNRRQLDEILAKEVERASRYDQSLALMVLDVDKFKLINDRYGHKAGDEVLKTLASILKNSVRGVDTVARFGGDEFAIIMPNTDEGLARKVQDRILAKVKALSSSSEELSFSISLGIKSGFGDEAKCLFEEVDSLMYRDKEGKKTQAGERDS